MKALMHQGAQNLRVQTMSDSLRVADDDLIVKITATAIRDPCLPLCRRRIPVRRAGVKRDDLAPMGLTESTHGTPNTEPPSSNPGRSGPGGTGKRR